MSVSQLARSIKASPTLKLNETAAKLREKGEPVIHLGGGEPKSKSPLDAVLNCATQLNTGEIRYAPADGLPALKKAILRYTEEQYGQMLAPQNVIVSSGAKQCIMTLLYAILEPKDEVVYPAPHWVSYPEMVKLAGAVPRYVLADDSTGFRVTPAMLEQAISPRTRMVFLNSPSNPTGAVYSREELEALVAVALKHGLYILSDEMYEHLVYDGARPTCVAALSKEAEARTITVAKLPSITSEG